MRLLKYVVGLALVAGLAACGGGGGAPGLPSGTVNQITTSAPTALTVAVGSAQNYSIVGGKAPYQIASSNAQVATVRLDASTFSITSVATGTANITISDSAQQTTTITVTVGNLSVFSSSAPSVINVAPKSTSQAYTITGGVMGAKYEWSSSDTRVATAQIDGNTLRINGLSSGSAKIDIRDSAPTPSVISINVTVGGGTSESLQTTAPSSITVAPLSLTTFQMGGGVAPYQAPTSTNSGVVTASINASGTTLSIVAGSTVGAAEIVIIDSARNEVRIGVAVSGGTTEALFTTVPNTGVTIGIGLTREFSVGGGVADYTVASSEEGIATVSKDSSNRLLIRGIAAGNTTITVRDRVGTTLTYSITVGSSRAVTSTAPATLAMVVGANRTFLISGGNPAYIASSSNEDSVSTVISGNSLSITARAAGAATIKIVDAAGTVGPAIAVTVTGGTAGLPNAAAVEVISSLSSLLSAGPGASITAFVKDAGNAGIANQAVTFSASSGTLQSPSVLTDASGVATATLIAGSDKTNRNIVVTVSSGTKSGQITVPVTGTGITIAGEASLQISTAAKPVTSIYTLRALDSSSNPVFGAALTLTSALGNTLSASNVITDATGTATVTYTPVKAGADVLKVVGLGATSETKIAVSAVDFSVVSPAANMTIVIGVPQVVTVQYQLAGVGQAGKTVAFSTTRGTITPISPNTLPVGQYSATLSSTTAGQATVVAQITGVGSVSLPVEFVAVTPAAVVVQSNPGSVAPNTTGTTNQSTIEAVVRDAAGNPVKDRQINFTLTQDLSNGRLSSGSAITNSNGQASVQFIAGPSSTPNDGVVVTAVDALTGLSGASKLTVSGKALFITIGFGNEIGNVDETTYSKAFSVYVTDANGVAVGNQLVTLSVIPTRYGKGRLRQDPDLVFVSWILPDTATFCPNEDTLLGSASAGYLNGILNTGEDFNGNGRLDPGNVAVAAPGSVTTDANGRATFALQYGEQFAPWVTVNIEARAVVSGTESRRSLSYELVGFVEDFTSLSGPAGVNSPFGSATDCSNKN